MRKIIGGIIAALALGIITGPQANASPSPTIAHQHDMAQMCMIIASNPTVFGVASVISSWQAQYGTSDAAASMGAQTLLDAITYDCPEYAGIVYQAVQQHKSRQPSPSVPVSPDGIEHDTVV